MTKTIRIPRDEGEQAIYTAAVRSVVAHRDDVRVGSMGADGYLRLQYQDVTHPFDPMSLGMDAPRVEGRAWIEADEDGSWAVMVQVTSVTDGVIAPEGPAEASSLPIAWPQRAGA